MNFCSGERYGPQAVGHLYLNFSSWQSVVYHLYLEIMFILIERVVFLYVHEVVHEGFLGSYIFYLIFFSREKRISFSLAKSDKLTKHLSMKGPRLAM